MESSQHGGIPDTTELSREDEARDSTAQNYCFITGV